MKYNENEDELQRLRTRRTRPSQAAPSDDLDEAYYYEEEYEGPSLPFESEPRQSARRSSVRSSAAGPSRTASNRSHGQRSAASRPRHSSAPSSHPQPRRTASKRTAAPAGDRREAARRPGKGGPRKQAARRKRGGFKKLILLVFAAILVYGGWLFIHRPTGYWNIAVFGVDSRDGNTQKALADVQMICSVNRETGEIKLVSVYRDTYLKINSEGTFHKINEAYFKGGQEQAVAALEENLDLTIDDYATFNWTAVANAINILGGIDLEITPAEFKYINAFITETVESTGIASVHLAQAGMNHLDGVQAVAYSRLRLMDTDFQRTERQRKVVSLALDKAKQASASELTALAKAVLPEISTSVGIDDVLPLVKDIDTYHIAATGGFPFSRQTARVGKMDCVIPTTLESNVILLHQFLYGEDVSYSPSSAVKKISAQISEETGLYEEGKAAPPSSGGSSQGSSGGSQTAAPAPTAAPETLPETSVEETPEETAEETEETEESTEAETIETLENEEKTDENSGPGVQESTSQKPSESQKENDGADEIGPGVSGPAGSAPGVSSPGPSGETEGQAEPSGPSGGPGAEEP